MGLGSTSLLLIDSSCQMLNDWWAHAVYSFYVFNYFLPHVFNYRLNGSGGRWCGLVAVVLNKCLTRFWKTEEMPFFLIIIPKYAWHFVLLRSYHVGVYVCVRMCVSVSLCVGTNCMPHLTRHTTAVFLLVSTFEVTLKLSPKGNIAS